MAFPRELFQDFRIFDEDELRRRQRQQILHLRREMSYVDDFASESRSERARALVTEAQSEWEQEVLQCQQLLLCGVDASSTDHEEQSIANTLNYSTVPSQPVDFSFWSSTGSDDQEGSEYLTYRMRFPQSVVHSVRIQVYRARYQPGEPIYPPSFVRIEVGPTLESLHDVTGWKRVRVTCRPQTFHVPVAACAGQFIRLRFRGKPQRQLEDMRHYLAIHRVWAYGWSAGPVERMLFRLKQLRDPRCRQPFNGTYAHGCYLGGFRRPANLSEHPSISGHWSASFEEAGLASPGMNDGAGGSERCPAAAKGRPGAQEGAADQALAGQGVVAYKWELPELPWPLDEEE
uniref:Uncharacterized protein n=1 Tax=Tetraselmis sp. GSL018 TaxID=582737 RepID=A0A061RP07_9CHLO|mmetsp:Transcript_20573/g.48985  ORF Transcript_20573/g.48985 Transcript_20573/m.48985 type:complete len:345 (+) Transcript_20573:154-1188(+)